MTESQAVEAPESVEDETVQPPPRDRDWPRPWMPMFFAAMSALPDVTAATRHAGVSRQTVYRWRNSDEEFAAAWDESIEIAQDTLQRQARTWAVSGLEQVSTKTTVVEKVDAAGNVLSRTTTTIEDRSVNRSPAVLIFMLKAWLPERYRWVERIGVGGDPEGAPFKLDNVSAIDARIAELTAMLEQRAAQDGSPKPVDY